MGHYGYKVFSLNSWVVARVAISQALGALKLIGVLGLLGALEFWSRFLGSYDYYVKGKKHEVWEIAWTTKEVNREGWEARNRRQFGGATPIAPTEREGTAEGTPQKVQA